MNIRAILCLAAMAGAFAGCTGIPQPRPQAMDPYVARPAGPDIYRLSYRGDAAAAPERILDFALAHASHLTHSEGYRYFAVIDEAKSGGGEIHYHEDSESLENRQDPRSLLIQAFQHRPKRIQCFRAGYTAKVVYEKYGLNRRPM